MQFPDQPFTDVYVIYDADVLAETSRFIDRMSPAVHMTAGYSGERQAEHARIAALFTQTEGDEEYSFGYLGSEHNPPRVRYFPAGFTDAEGTTEPAECAACKGMGNDPADPGYDCQACDGRGSEPCGQGYHRKWVAELTRDEWLAFADAYAVDLDADGYPDRYEETLGSITEHGHLEAVSVDNREGWDDYYSNDTVINSGMYVSFAYASDPSVTDEDRELAAQVAAMENDGAGLYAAAS
jgi:hypothetical protein